MIHYSIYLQLGSKENQNRGGAYLVKKPERGRTMSSGKALTDGQYRELVGSLVEGIPNRELLDSDAIEAHLRAKTISHEALKLMLSMEPERAVELLVVWTSQVSILVPAGLQAILESQVNRLMDIGAFGEPRIGKDKYRDELMAAVQAFVWRPELAAIGLTKVALVDYRLRGRFLAEAGSVHCYIEPECKNFKGVVTPDGVLVIQAQWGEKYRNKKPIWCRSNFPSLEQGGVVKEGLTAYLYGDGGEKLLRKCYMDFAGSVSESGDVPYLSWGGDRAILYDHYEHSADPSYGSVSRGK